MDDPSAVVTNAPSTSSDRRLHREAAWRDVGRTSTEMLRVGSTTDSPVVGRTPVPRQDGQRPASSNGTERLEDGEELLGWTDEPAAVMAPELG